MRLSDLIRWSTSSVAVVSWLKVCLGALESKPMSGDLAAVLLRVLVGKVFDRHTVSKRLTFYIWNEDYNLPIMNFFRISALLFAFGCANLFVILGVCWFMFRLWSDGSFGFIFCCNNQYTVAWFAVRELNTFRLVSLHTIRNISATENWFTLPHQFVKCTKRITFKKKRRVGVWYLGLIWIRIEFCSVLATGPVNQILGVYSSQLACGLFQTHLLWFYWGFLHNLFTYLIFFLFPSNFPQVNRNCILENLDERNCDS